MGGNRQQHEALLLRRGAAGRHALQKTHLRCGCWAITWAAPAWPPTQTAACSAARGICPGVSCDLPRAACQAGTQFTGQASYEAEFGLYYYKARWYDPHLGRFSQPDSMVPDSGNPLDWDRYAYVRNNPQKYVDPNGHNPLLFLLALAGGVVIGGAIGGGYLAYDIFVNTPPIRSINGTDVARPTSTNMTEWTLKQIKDGLNSPMLDAIKSNWGSSYPLSKGAAAKLWVGMVRGTGYWDYKPDILEALGKGPSPSYFFRWL